MSDEPGALSTIPAATLIVCRRGRSRRGDAKAAPPEILMVRRAAGLRFAGGAVVFPGGRVDPGDHELAAHLLPHAEADWAAAQVAAIRETLEESGLLVGLAGTVSKSEALAARQALLAGRDFGDILADNAWSFADDALVPYARWCPPDVVSRVFDTRFFIADVGTGEVAIAADGTETETVFWMTAGDALHRAKRREFALVHPTRRNLQRLEQFGSFAQIRLDALHHPPRLIRPILQELDGQTYIGLPQGHGYPVDLEPFSPI